jgi:hypothetical protein
MRKPEFAASWSLTTLFLQPYPEASTRFPAELSALSSLSSTNPFLAGQVAAIAATFMQFDGINKALLHPDLIHDAVVELLRRQKQAMDILRGES